MAVAVTHYAVQVPGVPAVRIALLADLHACWPVMTLGRVRAIVDQCNALGADMICLLGDYAGHALLTRRLPVAEVTKALTALHAPLGVWAIFGNHDWYDDDAAWRGKRARTHWHDAFADAGLRCLVNDAVVVDTGAGCFALAGLESQRAHHRSGLLDMGRDDLPAALDAVPADMGCILLAHEPDIFVDVPLRVGLTLCGHMHAGQIRLFGRAWVGPSRFGTRYAYGHFAEGGRQMIVSGGLGTSGLPLRLGAPPELTVVEIAA